MCPCGRLMVENTFVRLTAYLCYMVILMYLSAKKTTNMQFAWHVIFTYKQCILYIKYGESVLIHVYTFMRFRKLLMTKASQSQNI